MTIQNYIDLRLAVNDHVGNRAISDVFPTLVQLAETDLNSRLRTRHQVYESTLYFDGGVSPLPHDFMELISFPDGRGGSHHPRYSVDGFNISIPGFSGERCIR